MKLTVAFLLCVAIVAVYGSSHSEAPGTAKIPNADITDIYAFMSYETNRANFVTFLVNVQPLQNPYGGPNYYSLSDDHFYELYIDSTGDLIEDITFQFFFGFGYPTTGGTARNVTRYEEGRCQTDPVTVSTQTLTPFSLVINGTAVPVALKVYGVVGAANPSTGTVAGLNWIEWYYVNQIFGYRENGTVFPLANPNGGNKFYKPFDYAGEKSFGNSSSYESYARSYIYSVTVKDYANGNAVKPDCGQPAKIFVGQRREAFNINLGQIFDLINFIPLPALNGHIAECDSNNALRVHNVDTIAIEIAKSCILSTTTDVIGTWAATRKLFHNDTSDTAHFAGSQVSRMGNPLVNELVIGLPEKANFNAQRPTQDGVFADYVFKPTMPQIIEILFGDTVRQILTGSTSGPSLAPTNFPRGDIVATFLTGFPTVNQPLASAVVGEVMRLNTTIPPAAAGSQHHYGVIGSDFAGFPNGRRPGDDVVDVALMVMTGRLCYLVTKGTPLTNNQAILAGLASVLGCNDSDAFAGGFDVSDGAPLDATYVDSVFPYLRVPLPGSVTDPNPGTCKLTTYPYVSQTTTTGGATTGTGSAGSDGGNCSPASSLRPSSILSYFF